MAKELTEKQRLYLRLVFIEGKNHEDVAKLMGVQKRELSGLWEELKEERERLQPVSFCQRTYNLFVIPEISSFISYLFL